MRIRRWATGGLSAAGAVVMAAATAWACVSGPAVSLSTITAAPGDEIAVTGSGFSASRGDVAVRMDTLDAAVIARMTPPSSGATTGSFTVPANAAAGNHVVLFTQHDQSGGLSQMPVRALLTVVPEGGTAPAVGAPIASVEPRDPGLLTSDDPISTGSLVLIGAGVAGIAMFLAGAAALVAGRRAQAPVAAKVRS